MIADEVGGPGYMSHYLWKLLIDERHQPQGYKRCGFERTGEVVLDEVLLALRLL